MAPGGTWEYGRLEIFDGNFFSIINEDQQSQEFVARAAVLACRSFGYKTGAQLLVGGTSVLPASDGVLDTVGSVFCDPSAEILEDCELGSTYDFYEYGSAIEGERAVTLLCFNPSGTDLEHALQPAFYS